MKRNRLRMENHTEAFLSDAWSHVHNGQLIACDLKTNIESSEFQPIDPIRVALIGWPWIVGKDPHGGRLFALWKPAQKLLRKINPK